MGSSRCVAVLLRSPSACFRVRCVAACIPSSDGVSWNFMKNRTKRELPRARLCGMWNVVCGGKVSEVGRGCQSVGGRRRWGRVSERIHTYMQLGNPAKSRSKCTFILTPPCQRGVNIGLKLLTEGRRASRTVPFYGLSAKKLALGKLRPLFLFAHLVGKFHPRRTTTTAAKVAARRTKRRL